MHSATSIERTGIELRQIVDSIKKGDTLFASKLLDALVARGSDDLSPEYGTALAKALREGGWEEVGELFVSGAAISKTGHIFHVAPFCKRQVADREYHLTALWGEVLQFDMPAVCQGIIDSGTRGGNSLGVFGHAPPQLVPIRVVACSGLAEGALGKTFYPPEFWDLPNSEKGPALLNVSLMREKTLGPAGEHIKKISTPETSRLLLHAHSQSQELSEALFAFEYQLHEAGHSYGIGINNLIERNWLQNNLLRTIEEWRTDGFEYHNRNYGYYRYNQQAIEPEGFRSLRDTGQIGDLAIASNLLLRFGIIGIRPNPEEADIGTALLTFDRLLRAGDLIVTSNDKLHIPGSENGRFPKSFGIDLGEESERVTRQLLRAQSFEEFQEICDRITVPENTKNLFFNIVRGEIQ